jgi:hypothetical protein
LRCTRFSRRQFEALLFHARRPCRGPKKPEKKTNYIGLAGEKYSSLPGAEQLKLLYGSNTGENEQGELTFSVTKKDGSKTTVVLKKEGSEFVGPKGERYPNMPTEEQLSLIYGN